MMRKATVIVTLILALVTWCWGAAPRGKSDSRRGTQPAQAGIRKTFAGRA